jgi:16S rRNA processing protein RimM
MGEARVCLGVIAGRHGVRGLVRIKSFTAVPEDVASYGPLSDEQGRQRFDITVTGRAKGALLARIEGVGDRDRAQALTGTRLYVERSALPAVEEEETYYYADLIGLAAEDREGRSLGRVVAVHDFGAGDVLELDGGPEGRPLFLPFTRVAVPLVDLERGRIVVDPPAEAEPQDEQAEDEGG